MAEAEVEVGEAGMGGAVVGPGQLPVWVVGSGPVAKHPGVAVVAEGDGPVGPRGPLPVHGVLTVVLSRPDQVPTFGPMRSPSPVVVMR